MPDIALLALFLLAITIGYLLGKWDGKNKKTNKYQTFNKDYFVGLNYLLNEQTDKAIDTFIQALNSDTDTDTVDTYLALGHFFCKRGEVDKSIQIHQDLLARTSLTSEQSEKVQLALSQDYLSAGLFDRAEAMLRELVDRNPSASEEVLHTLSCIYEQEKEWGKAIKIAERLKSYGARYGKVLAQYYCELAEQYLAMNDRLRARKLLKMAMNRDKLCIRASLIQGLIEFEEGNLKDASKVFERVLKQDSRYFPLAVPYLEKIYRKIGNSHSLGVFLASSLKEKPTTATILAMTRIIHEQQGEKPAIIFLVQQLREHPTLKGLNALLGLQLETGEKVSEQGVRLFMDLTTQIVEVKPVYKCSECGFMGKDMHWQCPKCKGWNSIAPIEGLEGE
ncbi:Lipopolysaccharide assembly protein B [invertebrate metagenome]|uniref:Lipopolysaccharide assembly protein B n=1 Tax=invertebrate metagenome TaxID=1711999 RepID=A0A2H9T8P2_9ZZZZ